MAVNDEIKEKLEKGQLTIGKNAVLKKLKAGALSRVVFSNKCDPGLKQEIITICGTAGVKFESAPLSRKDLGALCKKSFGISVLGFVV